MGDKVGAKLCIRHDYWRPLLQLSSGFYDFDVALPNVGHASTSIAFPGTGLVALAIREEIFVDQKKQQRCKRANETTSDHHEHEARHRTILFLYLQVA